MQVQSSQLTNHLQTIPYATLLEELDISDLRELEVNSSWEFDMK